MYVKTLINSPGHSFNLSKSDYAVIEIKIQKLTIKEKVAQLVFPWSFGNYCNSNSLEYKRLESLVKDYKVGGIVFFKGDILNEALLINKLQNISEIPLLIASDFERGLGMRLTDAIEFPFNMALAATGNTEFAFKMGKVIADECRAMGVHQDYAPVADINNNPNNPIINIRAYSSNKNIVSAFSNAFIKGLNFGNVISTAKHFPGHGNTEIDSHNEMPTIKNSKSKIFNNELFPFRSSIEAGVNSIMLGHLNVPHLQGESSLPASLSKKVVTNILINKFGFKGLIVTDAMNMNAVTKNYSAGEAAVMAIKAGIDLILMPPDAQIAINAIVAAVLSGEIKEERINQSLRKLLEAKKWLRIEETKISNYNVITDIVNSPEHISLANEIAEKSITLVKDDNNLLPISYLKSKTISIITIYEGVTIEKASEFSTLYEREFGAVQKFFIGDTASSLMYKRSLKIASKSDIIIMPAYISAKAFQGTINFSDLSIEFIDKLIHLNRNIIVLSFGSPYLLSAFPDVSTYLCAYGDVYSSQIAMLNSISGKKNITGKLPVSIPNTKYKLGDGIIKKMII